jgi:hypothetical protein
MAKEEVKEKLKKNQKLKYKICGENFKGGSYERI